MKHIVSYFEPVTMSDYDKPIINEHLKSLKPRHVLAQLNNKFARGPLSFKISGVSNFSDDSPAIQILAPEKFAQHKEVICQELDLMMWCMTSDWMEGGLWQFQIEPVQANQCNDYVYKNCGGIIYHLTDKNSAERILNGGLRNKGKSYESGDYRSFPARTYFITGTDSNDVKNAIESVRKSFGVIGKLKLSKILKIDLNQYGRNLEFYHDPFYDIPNAIFAYSNIPGALITEVDDI